ncbi:MAG: 4-hydroxybenzoate octaprenyltransferase [Beijerinckiaceae bacterium]|nr:4-hydroxybenzoate octaprenyltransferase [Beijerinckiaceae bacterium]MCZ8298912.1 4-hydroxybenzoate octaprenyltransferase [Beijerinckiaceae bacterium]
MPGRARPFARMARLDRPIGWWLLLLPCWWSEALAARLSGGWPNLLTLLLFLIGAVAMRGAGSTWNDITDRDLDARVARTRDRPLPSGQVTVRQAFAFLVLQALVGLTVLLQFNAFAIAMGILSLAPVVVYPFMKRFTNHPQLVLGLAFAWGALMGFAVHLGTLPGAALWLYAGAIAWVVGYDTIYALQDIEDDAIVGIGSTARAYGARVRLFIAAMFVLTLLLVGIAMLNVGSGLLGWLGLAAFAGHLGWQVAILKRDDPVQALRLFRANRDAGLLLSGGLLLDAVLGRLL